MLGDQPIVNGMLIVIAVSTLTFAYRHLRPLPRPAAERALQDRGGPPGPAATPG